MLPPQYFDLFNNQPVQDTLEFILHQLLATLLWHVNIEHIYTYHRLNNIIFLWNVGLEHHIC
jgi:hypothetical protein